MSRTTVHSRRRSPPRSRIVTGVTSVDRTPAQVRERSRALGLRFLVGYVALGERSGAPIRAIHPRIFYKDSSLIWRVARHFVHDAEEYWIGKGDVRVEDRGGEEYLVSSEETTLPLELQFALDDVSRRRRRDDDAIGLIVREAPSGRIRPYADFSAPRRAAAARPRGTRSRGSRGRRAR